METTIVWSYCAKCKHETKHTALFQKELEERIYYSTHESFIQGKNIYWVLECNGCEEISFRKDYHDFMSWSPDGEFGDEEDETPEEQRYVLSSAIFPSQLANHSILEPLYYLPERIRSVYEQTILSLKGNSTLLAGVGFRAVIEAICIEEQIKGRNLEQKINSLVKNNFITEKEADRLHSIRFLGNDSVHEMEIPSDNQLFLVLNIIEHLLKNIYILDKTARNVLDTIIKDYGDFETLVINLIVKKLKVGDVLTLKDILGKHKRRVVVDMVALERELVQKIQSNKIEHLAIHNDNKPEISYTIISTEDPLPF